MANSSSGNEKRDVKPKKAEVGIVPAEPVSDPVVDNSNELVAPVVKKPAGLDPRIKKTLDSAIKGGTVRIKSEKNFRAAKAALAASNPLNLKVEWKPGLGHHSIAVG